MSDFKYTTDILIYSIDSRKNDNTRELPKKYFSILLVKRDKEPFKDMWCLPGGFVNNDETSYDAAKRVLKKETNISDAYIEQLCVSDKVDRDPRGRVVSTSYIALVDKSKIKDKLSNNTKWFDIEINEDKNINIKLSNEEEVSICINKKLINEKAKQYKYELVNSNNIAFDHGELINRGIIELRNKANNSDIIFNLMPNEFTIGELKQVYEIILGKKLINSAFRRVIASKVESVSEVVQTGGHRPSQMFKYKKGE